MWKRKLDPVETDATLSESIGLICERFTDHTEAERWLQPVPVDLTSSDGTGVDRWITCCGALSYASEQEHAPTPTLWSLLRRMRPGCLVLVFKRTGSATRLQLIQATASCTLYHVMLPCVSCGTFRSVGSPFLAFSRAIWHGSSEQIQGCSALVAACLRSGMLLGVRLCAFNGTRPGR